MNMMRRNNHTVSALPVTTKKICASSSPCGGSTCSATSSSTNSVGGPTNLGKTTIASRKGGVGGKRYLVRLPTCWTLNVLVTVFVSISLLFTSTIKQYTGKRVINEKDRSRLGAPINDKNENNEHARIDGDSQGIETSTLATSSRQQQQQPQRETELSLLNEFGFPPISQHILPNGNSNLLQNAKKNNYHRISISVANNEMINPDPNTETTSSSSLYDQTTAIFVISMGDMATSTNLVERCLRSIRTRGNYFGRFVILTDHPERYESLKVSHEGVSILVAKSDDVNVQIEGGGTLSVVMRYKRFKTLLLDYMDEEPELDDVRRVAYMDYDIVVGRDLGLFWSDVDELIQNKEKNNSRTNNPLASSYMYFFKEDWNKRRREPFHAGIMILDRQYSGLCLDVWRHEIDTGHVNRDQQGLKLLHDRIENGLEQNCDMRYIEPRDKHLLFPTTESMKSNTYATFVHVTNTKRAKVIDSSVQKEFFTKLLKLDDESDASLSEVHTVPKWKTQVRKAKEVEQKMVKESQVHLPKESLTLNRVLPDTSKIVKERITDLITN